MITQADIDAITDELSGLFGSGKERARLADSHPDLDLRAAYGIAGAVRQRRVARGDRWVGRKIGFTNHHMWEVYDVKAPIWGPMYESSVRQRADGRLDIGAFPNPKIEPEIVFGLLRPPTPA